MSKKIALCLLLLSFCFSQWKTKSIVYSSEIKGNKIQSGADFVFVGLQFKSPIASWHYDIDDKGDIFFSDYFLKSRIKDFIEKLPQKFGSFALFQPDKKDAQAYKKSLGKIQADFVSYPFREMILLDADPSGDFLDEAAVDYLNERAPAKYYGTIVLSIPYLERPHIVNKFEFTLDTQISFILYERSGKKVLVRNFKRHSRKMDIEDLTYKRSDVYWENFLAILDENKRDIDAMVSSWDFKNKNSPKNVLIKSYFGVQ